MSQEDEQNLKYTRGKKTDQNLLKKKQEREKLYGDDY